VVLRLRSMAVLLRLLLLLLLRVPRRILLAHSVTHARRWWEWLPHPRWRPHAWRGIHIPHLGAIAIGDGGELEDIRETS
jgi:hypothetical protein